MVDMKGRRYGRLYVLEKSGSKNGRVYWKCQCDCGNVVDACGSSLRNGDTSSCGCLHKELLSNRCKKHGMTGTRLYRIWQAMIKRCNSPNYPRYSDYGGRGITVCNEWLHDFQVFYDWSMANGYADDLTIDRKDNEGNYEPSNCRWTTYKEQGNNTRRNHNITYNGETHTMAEWARIKGIKYSTLAARLNIHKWDIDRALNA